MGLITTIIINNKTHFIAASPEVLVTSLQEKQRNIKKVLPLLQSIHNKITDRPIAEVFQGKIAVIKLLEEILDNATVLQVIGSHGNALEKIGYHPEKFRMKRIANKIKIQQILEESKEARNINSDKYTKIRFIKSLQNSKEAIFIFDFYVYHLILQYEISAIKIKSKDHAQTMRIMFNELWGQSRN